MVEAGILTLLLKHVPPELQGLIAIVVLLIVMFYVVRLTAMGKWIKDKAEARRIVAETDLKLIDQYKTLLDDYKKTAKELQEVNAAQHKELKRLNVITDALAQALKDAISVMQEHDVPTDQIPNIDIGELKV